MASRCLLLFFVFLSLAGQSEEGCHDHFSIEYWKGANMTDLIPLINATSTEKILNCTIWKNRNLTLFGKINNDCFNSTELEQMCNQTTEGKHKIHVFHFRCLYAKLHNVNYTDESAKDIYGDCENFISGINTFQQLWNSLDNDGTSAGATSVSPSTTSTLWSTTTMTTSTPTISMSRRTTTLTTFTPTMSSSLGTTTLTTSPTTTSMSSRTTTLRSLLTPSTLTPNTTSTTSTPTISTSSNTTTLTTSPTTTSTSLRTTMLTATTLKSRRTTTSTRSPTTTSKSSLTTQSTAKGKIQLSSKATLKSPTDFGPCLPGSFQSVPMPHRSPSTVPMPHRSPSTVPMPHRSPSTETSTPTWQTASILVLLVLSIMGNFMQGLNSFLQKRKLNMKQKQMGAECICLNPDATAAEKSPEENLSYSNESVH